MIPVLFVGGPRDGERVLYTGTARLSEYIVIDLLRRTGYRLAWLRTTEDHAVYIAEHMTADDALHAAMHYLGYARTIPPALTTSGPARTTSAPAPLMWHACSGRDNDPHDEVRWQGGPDCWVCGQPGMSVAPPKIKDQEVAPYGWT